MQTRISLLPQPGTIGQPKIHQRKIPGRARSTSTDGQQLHDTGVFAANPFRPIFNPYMQRSLYQNKRYLKQKKNKNKHQNKQNKFTYKQPKEPEQIQAPKKLRRSGETEKQKGKRPASENENLTKYNTPTKKSKTRS